MAEPRSSVPIVSVVLPTYQRRALLEDAVASVLAQTLEDFELIICDDGSTDDTRDFLVRLGDPRIRVVTLPHTGRPSLVRNRGIQQSVATYVAFLDDDDFFHPRKLELQVQALEARPEYGVCYTAVDIYDEHGALIPKEVLAPWLPHSGEILPQILDLEARMATPSVMVRRVLLDRLGGFDETLDYSEDFELWVRLGRETKFLALPESLSSVRARDRMAKRQFVDEAFVRIYRKFRREMRDPALRDICDSWIHFFGNRVAHQMTNQRRHLACWKWLAIAGFYAGPSRAWARVAARNIAYAGLRTIGLK